MDKTEKLKAIEQLKLSDLLGKKKQEPSLAPTNPLKGGPGMRFYVAIANAQFSFRSPDEQRAIVDMFMRMKPLIPAITEALQAQGLRPVEGDNEPDHGFNYIDNPLNGSMRWKRKEKDFYFA